MRGFAYLFGLLDACKKPNIRQINPSGSITIPGRLLVMPASGKQFSTALKREKHFNP
jgi:hypothetical protein